MVSTALAMAPGARPHRGEAASEPTALRAPGTGGDFDGDGHRDTVATGLPGSGSSPHPAALFPLMRTLRARAVGHGSAVKGLAAWAGISS